MQGPADLKGFRQSADLPPKIAKIPFSASGTQKIEISVSKLGGGASFQVLGEKKLSRKKIGFFDFWPKNSLG